MNHQYFKLFQERLKCKIELIKTAKLLFGHCWAVYCHIGWDKSNTYLIKKPKNYFLFNGDFKIIALFDGRGAPAFGLRALEKSDSPKGQ